MKTLEIDTEEIFSIYITNFTVVLLKVFFFFFLMYISLWKSVASAEKMLIIIGIPITARYN